MKKTLASLLAATLICSTNAIGEEKEQTFKISTTNNSGKMTPAIFFNTRSIMDWEIEIERETQLIFTNYDNRVKIVYNLDVFKQGERDRYTFPIQGSIIFVATEKATPKAVKGSYLKLFKETENEKERQKIEKKVGNTEGKKLYSLPIEEVLQESNDIRGSFELQVERPYIIDCRFFGPRGIRYIIEQK